MCCVLCAVCPPHFWDFIFMLHLAIWRYFRNCPAIRIQIKNLLFKFCNLPVILLYQLKEKFNKHEYSNIYFSSTFTETQIYCRPGTGCPVNPVDRYPILTDRIQLLSKQENKLFNILLSLQPLGLYNLLTHIFFLSPG